MAHISFVPLPAPATFSYQYIKRLISPSFSTIHSKAFSFLLILHSSFFNLKTF
jgi:hypothetical protein